jgi:allophanate hydrolase subunit 1
VIDITNLSSTAHEKLMGLPDEGQFTIDINYDPDNAAHIALRNARKTRTRVEFQVTLTDSTATMLTFWGYVLGFAISGGVDKQVTASITVEIDGPVAEA